jgi:UDP-N-acetylglucosamine/UDP-N-acetylgalactosamine diphosphorylase
MTSLLLLFLCSYHLAEKTIESIDGPVAGVKLEQFIFDSIPYAPSVALFEVNQFIIFLSYLNMFSQVQAPGEPHIRVINLLLRFIFAILFVSIFRVMIFAG